MESFLSSLELKQTITQFTPIVGAEAITHLYMCNPELDRQSCINILNDLTIDSVKDYLLSQQTLYNKQIIIVIWDNSSKLLAILYMLDNEVKIKIK